MGRERDNKKRVAGPRRKRGRSSGSRGSSLPPPTQSFAPPPSPSRATIKLDMGKQERPLYKYYLLSFCVVCLLALLDGQGTALVWGFAIFCAGLSVLIKPPRVGLGRWGDLAVLGFLAVPLLSFLPNFYWPIPDWRVIATDSLGIEFPAALSVQPWSSLEAYLCVLAGVVWFYAAMQWQVNYGGYRRLFCGLSVLLSIWAGWLVVQHQSGSYELGMDGPAVPHLFGEGIELSAIFALGGIATFAYAAEGFRHRLAMPLFGLPATLLCFAALYLADARDALTVYYLGICLWLIWSLLAGSVPRLLCWGLSAVLLVVGLVIWVNDGSVGTLKIDPQAAAKVDAHLFGDTIDMVVDAPISGLGLGTFSSVFPQYRDAATDHGSIAHPGSDLLLLAAESGLLTVGFLALALWFYVRRWHGLNQGGSAVYRLIAMVSALAFFGLCLVNGVAHHPGSLYFGLLFAALALPRRHRQDSRIPPLAWRIAGACLLLFGLIWMMAGSFGWPFHSATQYARLHSNVKSPAVERGHEEVLDFVEKWVHLRPLDWQAYSERAKLKLRLSNENAAEATADFERARFVEPVLGRVTFEEGIAWLDKDAERVIGAWEATLDRELEDAEATFIQMLTAAEGTSNVLNGLARLSEASPDYRSILLARLKGEPFMRELRIELEKEPGLAHFGEEQRSRIVETWIEHGDFGSARDFVEAYADSLRRAWWLQSLIYKNEADFRLAVDSIRSQLTPPEIAESAIEEASLARVSRQFTIQPSNFSKGFALLATHLEGEDYGQALSVIDRMLAVSETDSSLHYWKAESLYQMSDYIDSWFAFEQYLIHWWNRPGPAAE